MSPTRQAQRSAYHTYRGSHGSARNAAASQAGFSLFEMLIVITIIGLLLGGYVIAQQLIHSSKLRTVLAEADTYRQALQHFHERYGHLPGDMPNAESFWGTDSGPCPSSSTALPKTATCDGNGDGRIGTLSALNTDESFRAWQHLGNAELVNTLYTGVVTWDNVDLGGGAAQHELRTGAAPLSTVKPGYFLLFYLGSTASDINVFDRDYGHVLMFGQNFAGQQAYLPNGPALRAEDAYALDAKADDGWPGTGDILGTNNAGVSSGYNVSIGLSATSCTTTNDPETANYNVTGTTDLLCPLIFRTGL